MLPLKTTIEDLDVLLGYLRPLINWVPLIKAKSALDSKITDNRKLEAAKYVGLIKRDGQNIAISDAGREYISSVDDASKAAVMSRLLANCPLYVATVEWMYHSKKFEPVKIAVAEQWHKHHSDLLEGAQGTALTDAVVFFMRFADSAGLGQFIRAGNNRPETYFKGDSESISAFVKQLESSNRTGEEIGNNDEEEIATGVDVLGAPTVVTPASGVPLEGPRASVQTSPAVHINVEIHIAADATAETVAEIFKNMRKYVLSDPAANGQ
jgi:hypothetical protein